jgi:hypothetical protein
MKATHSKALFASPTPHELEEQLDSLISPCLPWDIISYEKLTSELKGGPYSHLFLEFDHQIDVELIDLMHEKHPNLHIVIMHHGQFHIYLSIFRSRPWLKNFISCMPVLQLSDLQTVMNKFCDQSIFGLQNYFPENTDFYRITVKDSKEKESYIQNALTHFEQHLGRATKARLGNILDEMMMNVLWDAPRTPEGKPLYNNESRHTRIQLTPEQEGTITLAIDGKNLGISCSDPFGAITLEKIISYLNKCFYSEEQIGSEGAGAGLGLYMIYNLSENFTINVEKGKKTEFILLFKTHNALKKKERQKSFHYYERSPS